MPSPAEGVSVIVMAFNEADGLQGVAEEIHQAAARLGRPFEVIVIDDGSIDGTAAIADRLAATLPNLRVVHHEANQGLGGVYRTGFRSALLDYVTFFPADGQFPAEILERFAPMMAECDLVLGYLPDGRKSLVGSFLSAAERVLYRLLFGPLPRFQGIFMLRRSVLEGLPLTSTGRGWAVVMELIVRSTRARLRIRSEATPLRPRVAGSSKVRNLRTILSNVWQLVELRRDMG